MKLVRMKYTFEPRRDSMWVEPVKVNEKLVEIRCYGRDKPTGYVIGFVVDGEELEKTSTGSPQFMNIVGRNSDIISVSQEEMLSHLNIWGNYMMEKHLVGELEINKWY